MKKLIPLLIGLMISQAVTAQTADSIPQSNLPLFGFKITDYMVPLNDSATLVQIQLPDGMLIPMRQLALLRSNYSNTKDPAQLGWGRCQLIKGDYYYFGIHLDNKAVKPAKNDLIFTNLDYPATYKGRIFELTRQAIYLMHVDDTPFYNFSSALWLDKAKETALIDSLTADIQYTGKAMAEMNDNQDQQIRGGLYDGKKLFATMQKITSKETADFLDYVIARPSKYAGNSWKISELFATWMTSETPRVVK